MITLREVQLVRGSLFKMSLAQKKSCHKKSGQLARPLFEKLNYT